MKDGTRFDTHRAYLQPILARRTLTIYRYAYVTKVKLTLFCISWRDFDYTLAYSVELQIHLDRQKRAYGVTYYRHGVKMFARADREVVISAGTINSAHLLMLSGIGPKKHLHAKDVSQFCRPLQKVCHGIQ